MWSKIFKRCSRCLLCNRNYQKTYDKNFKKRFDYHDVDKFILLLWEGVYQNEYMGNWENLDEASLPEKNIFTVT